MPLPPKPLTGLPEPAYVERVAPVRVDELEKVPLETCRPPKVPFCAVE